MIIIYKGERVIFPPATIMQYINMSCYYLLSKSIDRGDSSYTTPIYYHYSTQASQRPHRNPKLT